MKLLKPRFFAAALCVMAAAPLSVLYAQNQHRDETPHYFSFVVYSALKIDPNEFIVEVSDPLIVDQYKSMLANQILQPRIAFVAKVEKGRLFYNDAWNFHVVPETLRIGENNSTEVCDAIPEVIEDGVADIGGAGGFLPDAIWCPWSMRISREVLR